MSSQCFQPDESGVPLLTAHTVTKQIYVLIFVLVLGEECVCVWGGGTSGKYPRQEWEHGRVGRDKQTFASLVVANCFNIYTQLASYCSGGGVFFLDPVLPGHFEPIS